MAISFQSSKQVQDSNSNNLIITNLYLYYSEKKQRIKNPSLSEDYSDIKGSVLQMIQATMERFRNLTIREKVTKVPNQMEAVRVFNYPYQAIEEAVVNAVHLRLS